MNFSNLTRRQRFALRLATLASVNTGVYVAYVSAIRSAKASRPSFWADDGTTDYDGVVRASYGNWWRSGGKVRNGGGREGEGR